MKKAIISTYATQNIEEHIDSQTIIVSEKQIGKCRGCLACRRLNRCINYDDDAQVCIPIINEADHLDIYLQPDGNIQRLMDRILYALDGTNKTYKLHIEDPKESEYLRRLLKWAKYTEI